ncbi:uncharacterized protein LOC113506903 isoform X4 [Trichoplusia ni]|uniref:Uncharacterized protein LOC113506903 isoform X4 n=1 Tax=Trichoplusia ni TaxID=7111 RepID=A0A7E5WZC0_TRINI|nr:uncharacterized protein LOC113506903 isoform X4 [Trichoplusia ni]
MPEKMLFNYETTYRTDFRDGKLESSVKTIFIPKVKKPRNEPIPLKDIQALFPLRDPHVPFNLFHQPTPIIRTTPLVMQKRYEKPVDDMRLEVQKTRPKVVMAPALSMDQVEEPTRQTIVDFVYKSTVRKALDEAVELIHKEKKLRAPLVDKYAPARPVTIRSSKLPYVSPEWRMPSASWDKKQIRTYTQPTRTFWLSRELERCVPCEQTAAVLAHRKLICEQQTSK